MLSLLLRSSVPGGDGGGTAAAAGRTRVAGRARTRIAIFIEAPRRRPHTIPHVNWLLAPHFFLDVTVHARTTPMPSDDRGVSDRQTLTPM